MAPKQKSKQPEIFLAIDVECVATACGHLDRTPVSVAICSESEEQIFSELISPKFSVHNYLTELTGFEAHHFQGARSFAEVMVSVRAHLGPNVVLVGQGIENDIRWLELTPGLDYKRFIDLADRFTTEIKHYGNTKHVVHGLQHVAKICLPDYTPSEVHSASTDALLSMRLFKLSGGRVEKSKELKAMHHKLRQGKRPDRSYLASHGYVIDDVCCAAYSTTPCRCRQPNVKIILAAKRGEYPYPYPPVPSLSLSPRLVSPGTIVASASVSAPPAPQAPSATVMPTAPPVAAPAPAPLVPPSPYLNDEYPMSYSTIQETQMRGGGRFNPHANYTDDHDNLYGYFYGNSGGSGRYD